MTAPPVLAAAIVGDAVLEACQGVGDGEGSAGLVLGSFSAGFYVRVGEALFAVAGPSIDAGPLHLILAAKPPLPAEGSPVHLEAHRLETGSCSIDLAAGESYSPKQPTASGLAKAAAHLATLDAKEDPPADIAPVWTPVRAALADKDLKSAGEALQGRGSGLTPTGDDVLAGLLLFTHWADPQGAAPAEVAQRAATGDLSRAFLAWAAVGQSIQPLHDLVAAAEAAATASDRRGKLAAQDRFDQAAAHLAAIGHSSGKALLAGLGLAAALWPLQ